MVTNDTMKLEKRRRRWLIYKILSFISSPTCSQSSRNLPSWHSYWKVPRTNHSSHAKRFSDSHKLFPSSRSRNNFSFWSLAFLREEVKESGSKSNLSSCFKQGFSLLRCENLCQLFLFRDESQVNLQAKRFICRQRSMGIGHILLIKIAK